MKFLSEIRICPWDRESHNARDKKRGKTYRRTILFSIFSIAGPVWPEDARDLPLIWKDSSCSHMMQSFRYKRNYTKLRSPEQSTFINSVAGLSINVRHVGSSTYGSFNLVCYSENLRILDEDCRQSPVSLQTSSLRRNWELSWELHLKTARAVQKYPNMVK